MVNNIFTLHGFLISCWASLFLCTFGIVHLTYSDARRYQYAQILRRFWIVGEFGAFFEEICPIVVKRFVGGIFLCVGILMVYWPLVMTGVRDDVSTSMASVFLLGNLALIISIVYAFVYWLRANQVGIMKFTRYLPDLFLLLDTPTKYSRNIIFLIAFAHLLALGKVILNCSLILWAACLLIFSSKKCWNIRGFDLQLMPFPPCFSYRNHIVLDRCDMAFGAHMGRPRLNGER